jgi:proteasome lid subunit RPN8/RPN11
MDVITQHLDAARARRVGGILVGRRRNSSVVIERAIPAARVEEHHGEIAFQPEVWEQTYDIMLERHPGSRIVGWYHSHPGSGAEFSDYDRRLHAVLFSEAPSVALVVDPLARQAAWYGWVLGRITPAERPDSPAPVEHPAKHGRAAVVAMMALGVAAAGAAGYWLGHQGTPDRIPTASVELRSKLGAEQDRVRQLREQLADAQAELKRVAALDASQRVELEAARRRLREAERAARPRTFVLHYSVRPGDSLWNLAERFYGHGMEWKRIYRANHLRLRDPNVLMVGQSIRIQLP